LLINELVLAGRKAGESPAPNPQLQTKAAETNALMARLQVDQVKVHETHQQLYIEEEAVGQIHAEAAILVKEAQKDLDQVMPLLSTALAAVEELKKKSDLAVVNTFVKPP
jgi:hypothetical protein